jgi:hypothetical protein
VRARDVVADRRQGEADGGPVPDGGGQPGGAAPAGPHDEHVDPPHPPGPHRLEERSLVRRAADHQHLGAGGAAVEVDAGGELDVLRYVAAGACAGEGPVTRTSTGSGGDGRGDERQRGDHHGGGGPPSHPPRALPTAEGDGDCGRQTRQSPQVELGQRQRRRDPGHPGDPGQQQPGRDVQHPGRPPTEQARRQPADEAPHHHRAGGGDGEEVGGQRRQRHTPEDRHQHGRHPHLRGERDGEGRRHPPGLEPGADDGDAGAGADAEEEPDRAAQHRVDQHEPGDGEGEDAERRGRPPDGGGEEGQRRHGDGPEDGRLPTGEGAEDEQYRRAADQAPPQAQPAQERRRHGQGKRNVLTGDGQQVREAGGPEVVDLLGRLVPVVADHQPREQGPPWR